MFNRISSNVEGVVWSWAIFVFLVLPMLYPSGTLAGFAKATKTCPAGKQYWRPLNSKRSLPVLKWTSESKYFLSSKKKFLADTKYIQSKSNHLAHVRRGVIISTVYV